MVAAPVFLISVSFSLDHQSEKDRDIGTCVLEASARAGRYVACSTSSAHAYTLPSTDLSVDTVEPLEA